MIVRRRETRVGCSTEIVRAVVVEQTLVGVSMWCHGMRMGLWMRKETWVLRALVVVGAVEYRGAQERMHRDFELGSVQRLDHGAGWLW